VVLGVALCGVYRMGVAWQPMGSVTLLECPGCQNRD